LEPLADNAVHFAMRSIIPLGLLLVSACSSGPRADLSAIKGIRSAAAEWALVNREAGRRRLPPAYADGTREFVRDTIARESRALVHKNSEAARHAAALLALPGEAAPGLISAHVDALRHIETALESS
jgi:hypothetical protein